MCANYTPPPPRYFREHFAHLEAPFEYKPEAYPVYDAPILLPGFEPARAMFGLFPQFAKSSKYVRDWSTYNARTETVASKVTYKGPWKRRQFCLVPAVDFFEPNYETGAPVRWRIHRTDRAPFAIAGIWESRRDDAGVCRSFSMLTVNATEHPLMKRFHKPADEKRSVVVVDAVDYERWLTAKDEDDVRSMLKLFDPEAFTAEPAPRPPRLPRQAAQPKAED